MSLGIDGWGAYLTGLVLLLLPATACGAAGRVGPSAPTPAEIPAGTWVGEGARATVSAEGAAFDLDCAGAAAPPPLTLDAGGNFSFIGWWERRAGPQPYRRNEARLSGHVQGRLLVLTITLTADGETLGPYELTLGGSGREPAVCR